MRPNLDRLHAQRVPIEAANEVARTERTSIRWPVALRRRFLSGLSYSTRKCWPYTPYWAAAHAGRRLERAEFDAASGWPAGA
jgi:hypothetical protein